MASSILHRYVTIRFDSHQPVVAFSYGKQAGIFHRPNRPNSLQGDAHRTYVQLPARIPDLTGPYTASGDTIMWTVLPPYLPVAMSPRSGVFGDIFRRSGSSHLFAGLSRHRIKLPLANGKAWMLSIRDRPCRMRLIDPGGLFEK